MWLPLVHVLDMRTPRPAQWCYTWRLQSTSGKKAYEAPSRHRFGRGAKNYILGSRTFCWREEQDSLVKNQKRGHVNQAWSSHCEELHDAWRDNQRCAFPAEGSYSSWSSPVTAVVTDKYCDLELIAYCILGKPKVVRLLCTFEIFFAVDNVCGESCCFCAAYTSISRRAIFVQGCPCSTLRRYILRPVCFQLVSSHLSSFLANASFSAK